MVTGCFVREREREKKRPGRVEDEVRGERDTESRKREGEEVRV